MILNLKTAVEGEAGDGRGLVFWGHRGVVDVDRPGQAGAGKAGGAGPLIVKFCSRMRWIIRAQRWRASNCSAGVSKCCNQRKTATIRGFKSGASAWSNRI